MKLKKILSYIVFMALGLGQPLRAQNLSLEFMGGTGINFITPLTVHQDGYPDIQVSANYDTNPFGGHAPYYAWRVGLWNGDQAWEFEHIHHKLYLANFPPEITDFAISHGYNYLLFGHAWKWGDWVFHLDIGPIVTHPESIVRGMIQNSEHGGLFDGGYYFSGLGFHSAIGRNFPLNSNLFGVAEVALTAGFAWWVPTASGWADVPNMALHGHLGLGYRF